MGTRKGLCLNCQTKRIDHRIFPVNPEASTCFCPICMKEMEPKVAIDNYQTLISNMLYKADNTLFVACDPTLAYQQYADVLEFEADDSHALVGRILCLVYMGKVRKSYLREAYILLENTSFKGRDIDTFVNFLKKINTALDEYEIAITKKLVIKEHFYDIECLKLYWVHLCDIIKMKELILDTFEQIGKSSPSKKDEAFINLLENNIEEQKKILSLERHTTDGIGYKFTKLVNGRACVAKVDDTTTNHFLRFRLSTLDPNEKGKRLIKDEVFKDYTLVIKWQKVATFFAILLFALCVGTVIGTIVLRENSLFLWLLSGISALFFMVACLTLFQSLYWRNVFKKRELRIN